VVSFCPAGRDVILDTATDCDVILCMFPCVRILTFVQSVVKYPADNQDSSTILFAFNRFEGGAVAEPSANTLQTSTLFGQTMCKNSLSIRLKLLLPYKNLGDCM